MFGDMLGKLQEMKQKMDEIKERLERVSVMGDAANGKVKITCNGNKKVIAVDIDDELLKGDKEELEDLLIIAMNKALEKAENVNQSEMKSAAGGMLPNFPGLT